MPGDGGGGGGLEQSHGNKVYDVLPFENSTNTRSTPETAEAEQLRQNVLRSVGGALLGTRNISQQEGTTSASNDLKSALMGASDEAGGRGIETTVGDQAVSGSKRSRGGR